MKRNTYQLNHNGAGIMLTVCMGPRKYKQFDGGLSSSKNSDGNVTWAGIYSSSRGWSEALRSRVEELESINIRRDKKSELSSVSNEILTEIFEDKTMSDNPMLSISEIHRMSKKHIYNYPMAGATATVVLFYQPRNKPINVLLGLRGEKVDAFPGEWCLPGGFLEVGKETLEDTAVREIKEETNIDIHTSDLLLYHVHSDPKTDPRYHVVNTCYMVMLTMEQFLDAKAGDDLSEIKLFSIDKVLNMGLAFNHSALAEKAILQILGE